MREPPLRLLRVNNYFGITPACAGTTLHNGEPYFVKWDHPRVCGNHTTDFVTETFAGGSPPRVREPLYSESHLNPSAGITPACAGTTGNP